MPTNNQQNNGDNNNNVCNKHTGVVAKINGLQETTQRHEKLIQNLQNRLPAWATLLISILTFMLGAVSSYAIAIIRMQDTEKTTFIMKQMTEFMFWVC